MGKSCQLIPFCKNSKGEVVESKLYKDLLQHTSDRTISNEYYHIGTNEEFLHEVRDVASFDENGQITFNSLRRLAGLNIKEEKLMNSANKEISTGVHAYKDAIPEIVSFNTKSQFKEEFLATFKPTDNGNVEVFLVKNNSANRQELKKQISNRSLRDRIIERLNQSGVNVEFLETEEKFQGRYSTVNAERLYNGLYSLIQISHGEKVTEALAEEAGHFAVASLGNSPLINRLFDALTPEVQNKILGEDHTGKVIGGDPVREAAGDLVGKALMDEVDKTSIVGKLASRIANMAKRIYYAIKADVIANDRLKAESLARNIARQFMTQDDFGDINNALNKKETLFSAEYNIASKTFKNVMSQISLTASKLKSMNAQATYDRLSSLIQSASLGRVTSINMDPTSDLATILSLEGIVSVITEFSDLAEDGGYIQRLLDSIDFEDDLKFYENFSAHGNSIRQAHELIRNIVQVQKILNDALKDIKYTDQIPNVIEIMDDAGDLYKVNLRELNDKLTIATSFLNRALLSKEKQFFLKFVEQFNGSKYVEIASKQVWNIGKRRVKNPEGKTKLTRTEEAHKVSLESLLESLETDINMFERLFGSMSNNPDIIGQIADRVSKTSNFIADKKTNDAWGVLRVLEDRLKEVGLKTTDIMEKDSQGNYTGNMISEYNYGAYEKKWETFKKEQFEKFKEENPNLENMSYMEKTYKWDLFFRSKAKQWHRENSVWDKETEQAMPNESYKNWDFNAVLNTSEKLEWYQNFVRLKKDIDECLPEGSTKWYRLPQFRGNIINRVKNSKSNYIVAPFKVLGRKLRESVCEDIEDEEFGSNNTYNSDSEDPFGNALSREKEKINRIPLFGINKLTKMEDISTDIFSSMLSYASMAFSNEAMNNVVDSLEIGKEVLLDRKVGGIYSERDRTDNKSRAFMRYSKFLDKQVYGVNMTKTVLYSNSDKGHKIILEKVVGSLTKLASVLFLGGNVAGGMVNTGTGGIEIYKEALAGEYFTVKDWVKANKLYFEKLPECLLQSGLEFKTNKLDRFLLHFNAYGDIRQRHKEWDTQYTNRVLNLAKSSLFAPYKSGDHYMQAMAYLAMALNTELYDSNGNKVNLWDAYDNLIIDYKGNSKNRKDIGMKMTLYKTPDSKRDIASMQALKDKLLYEKEVNLTSEEKELLDKFKIDYNPNTADYTRIVSNLEGAMEASVWTTIDESKFADKCREINNRLHGIYNNQDKTAAHTHWLSNALLAMKGYALGMIERRFSGSKHSLVLGQETEGSLNTLAKVLMSTGFNYRDIFNTARLVFLPHTAKAKAYGASRGFSPHQIANMKRNWGDMLAQVLLFIVCSMFSLGTTGDDDEDKKIAKEADEDDVLAGILYYMSSRLLREQSAFNNPLVAYAESTSLLDLRPAGVAASTDVLEIAYLGMGTPFVDEDDSEFYYQSSKDGKYEKGDAKVGVKIQNKIPYLRSIYTFSHPYEAAKSYEFGRNVKSR